MFFEIANQYNHSFTRFHLFTPITDRREWCLLNQEWRLRSIQLGEKYLGYQFPYLSATDFMDFCRTGRRVNYEDKLFSKRLALNALVLAEGAENKGRFLDDIINGIFSICDENAWQLPAHNSYVRDTPQLLLPDITAPILDLFACETGAILATIYYLMGSILDEISPFITKRILHELEFRIFIPYINKHYWWMGDGKDTMNNWTIWCTQNVLIAAFLTNQKEEMKRNIFLKACKSVDYFLNEYGEDGCCDEGALYYRHAGLCLFQTIEVLNAVTGDAFKSIYQLNKIQNMATYILNVHINDKYYANFSDCSPIAGRAGVREFLFAERIGNENLAHFAAADFKADWQNSLLLPTEHNLYYRLQNAFTISEIEAYDTSQPIEYSDVYYPSVGIFSVRDKHLYLAVKAGGNADGHNHNDTGSFIVYKDGQPLIIDIGVESYTKKTFSPERYEIWTMQSAYHNLPTISGIMQGHGEEYRATDVTWQINNTKCEIRMDIAKAFPKECMIHSYWRQVILEKNNCIKIIDEFDFMSNDKLKKEPKEVVFSFMTYEKPVIKEDFSEDLLISIGDLGYLKISGAAILRIETIPITDARLMTAWRHEIYRILVQAEKNIVSILIE